MTDILQRKMARDYAAGATKRDAHPKSLGVLRGRFVIEPQLPAHLRVGVFREAKTYDCWLRASQRQRQAAVRRRARPARPGDQAAGRCRPAAGPGLRADEPPTMPLGTVKLFRDAVYYSIERSPLLLSAKLVLTGQGSVLKALKGARSRPTSPLDLRYWSTTPYRWGDKDVVKYGLMPTSQHRSTLPATLADDYLSQAMQAHLDRHDASFDFGVQLRKGTMPVEDAAVRWDETESPFVTVARLHIPRQTFRTPRARRAGRDAVVQPRPRQARAYAAGRHQPRAGGHLPAALGLSPPARPTRQHRLTMDPSPAGTEPIKAPGLMKLLLEARAPFEYAASLAAAPWLLSAPRGDGHAVLVYPGFLATDFSTRPAAPAAAHAGP
jgi:hypothetical protein